MNLKHLGEGIKQMPKIKDFIMHLQDNGLEDNLYYLKYIKEGLQNMHDLKSLYIRIEDDYIEFFEVQ